LGKPGGRVLVAVDDGAVVGTAELHPKSGRILIVAKGEVRPFQLLLAELGQRMQSAREWCGDRE
jgi:hypothetical protein